jgi:hypothetical protein
MNGPAPNVGYAWPMYLIRWRSEFWSCQGLQQCDVAAWMTRKNRYSRGKIRPHGVALGDAFP